MQGLSFVFFLRNGGEAGQFLSYRFAAPEIELRLPSVFEGGDKNESERSAVQFNKSKSRGDNAKNSGGDNPQPGLEGEEEDKTEASRASEIDKLAKRERPDYFIFDINELGDLELHRLVDWLTNRLINSSDFPFRRARS